MDFEFTDEQKMLRDTVRKFVEREMPKEKIRYWDKEEILPEGLWQKFAEVGFLGASIDKKYGGSGGNIIDETIICEELSRRNSSIGMAFLCDADSFWASSKYFR